MNNQPAFPYIQTQGSMTYTGMTLRDYFAAKGIETLMKSVIAELDSKHYSVEKAQKIQSIYASICYSMADAMLKAREA